MRNHTVRLYLATLTLFVFFALWATIAAKPWVSAAKLGTDPRLLALARWQHRLEHESVTVKRLVDRRWATYEQRLKARQARISAVEHAHVVQVAAARAAAARIAAAEAAAARAATHPAVTVTTTRVTAAAASSPPTATPAPAPSAPAPASAAPTVVTLPPQVQVVTLPPATSPATSSSSSRP
jgi:pilus assembly protein FimV